jgi:uncharacterized protein
MPQRDEYPAGVPCYVDTGRRDADAAKGFYEGLFGWEIERTSPEGAPPYYSATLGGLTVAGIGSEPDRVRTPVWNTYVRVDDADATAATVTEAGGRTTLGPFDVGPAGRMAVHEDPAGAEFRTWQPGTTRGAQLVNESGAWVFSTLSTSDPAGTEAFYGAVFGWTLGLRGEDGSAMLMKPGYADAQERQEPGFIERLQRYGAPEGFGDVVATTMPLSAGESPCWQVTFAVASLDASAKRVGELGGEVLVEPFDAPWVRVAVVRDPEGAVLTLSQFVAPDGT